MSDRKIRQALVNCHTDLRREVSKNANKRQIEKKRSQWFSITDLEGLTHNGIRHPHRFEYFFLMPELVMFVLKSRMVDKALQLQHFFDQRRS
jgi:hypothetical protein